MNLQSIYGGPTVNLHRINSELTGNLLYISKTNLQGTTKGRRFLFLSAGERGRLRALASSHASSSHAPSVFVDFRKRVWNVLSTGASAFGEARVLRQPDRNGHEEAERRLFRITGRLEPSHLEEMEREGRRRRRRKLRWRERGGN